MAEKKRWAYKIANKMRDYGDIDYDQRLIRINKRRAKKEGDGELLDSIVHEGIHRKHPKMYERNVTKKTERDIGRMGRKRKQRSYRLITKALKE